LVHAPPKFRFNLLKLGGQPPLHGGATDQELPVPVHPTGVSESEKVEGLWFPLPVEAPAVPPRKATEPDQACFLRVEYQRESLESLAPFLQKTPAIVLILETHNKVIRPSNDDRVAASPPSSPRVCPEIATPPSCLLEPREHWIVSSARLHKVV
jgi:hypothetical protein